MFYEFNQNNSGGVFHEDCKVCHRLFIEADNVTEAVSIAEELGCYWDGVDKGFDCPCCGDRWHIPYSCMEIPQEYEVGGYETKTIKQWQDKYGSYKIIKEPEYEKGFFGNQVSGKISFKDIEEYAQFLANEYGWTTPDIRIYYKNGTVKEIYTEK